MSDKLIIVDGIKADVTQDDFDDIEVLELLAEIGEGNGTKAVKLLKLVFGEEKYAEIKEKLRDPETGKTKTSTIMDWFQKVSEKVGAGN